MTIHDDDAAPLSPTEEQRVTDVVNGIVERRALIEQTKGMLMFIYGIDDAAAFTLLRAQSRNHNTKLGYVAQQFRDILLELSNSHGPIRKLPLDILMLAAHDSIARAAEQFAPQGSRTEPAR